MTEARRAPRDVVGLLSSDGNFWVFGDLAVQEKRVAMQRFAMN